MCSTNIEEKESAVVIFSSPQDNTVIVSWKYLISIKTEYPYMYMGHSNDEKKESIHCFSYLAYVVLSSFNHLSLMSS